MRKYTKFKDRLGIHYKPKEIIQDIEKHGLEK